MKLILSLDGFPTPSQEMEPPDGDAMNYRTLVCNDEGLRSLSRRLSSMNVTSVGRCLGLGERIIQKTEEDNIHDGTLKMYHLLVEWRNGQEQANWGMLADCLSTLNDYSLLQELKQIASRGSMDQGMVPELHTHVSSYKSITWSIICRVCRAAYCSR